MDANDVIDSYVHDVARRLPPGRRNDVAFELRALLAEELTERERAEDRTADPAMAVTMLRAFGRPAETAERYHRPFTVIPPGDTPMFLAAVIAGGSVLSLIAPLGALLAWTGLLVLGFGARSLVLHRHPGAFPWRPHPVHDPDRADRVAGLAAGAAWATLLALYLAPGPVVEFVTGGRVPATALAYSDSFAHWSRMPWLVGLLVAVIAVHLLVTARGRWSRATRWARTAVTASIAVQIGWHVRYGDVFADPGVDADVLPVVAALSGIVLLIAGAQLLRSWARIRPAPAAGSSV